MTEQLQISVLQLLAAAIHENNNLIEISTETINKNYSNKAVAIHFNEESQMIMLSLQDKSEEQLEQQEDEKNANKNES